MTLFTGSYVFRVQKNTNDADPEEDENQRYLNSFVKILETRDPQQLLDAYLRIDIASTRVQGYSVCRNGAMPLTEDPDMQDTVRLRIQSAATPHLLPCADFILREFLGGFLSDARVKGIELKIKGVRAFYYLWVQQDIKQQVITALTQQFPNVLIK